jgi:hypothetical protein
MGLLKQTVGVLGTLVVAVVIATVAMPKAAHGIVATLVQVANTSANPVPVTPTQLPAVQIAAFSGPETPDGVTMDSHGPYDVSSYATIRLSVAGSNTSRIGFCLVDPQNCPSGAETFTFALIGTDSKNNFYTLDSFKVSQGTSASRTYEAPSTPVQIVIIATCNGSCGGAAANFALFAR